MGILKGGFTPQGLIVCTQLSALGAQLILLTPTLQSSGVLQLVHLLREGTSNALIYAEECDITDLESVNRFADQWNKGEGSGGLAGGVGAGPASVVGGGGGGGRAPSSGGNGRDGSAGQGMPSDGPTPRRVEAIVFLPVDEWAHPTRYRIGQGDAPKHISSTDSKNQSSSPLEVNHAEILGRFHLVNAILPSLLLLPPHRDVRIVSLMSPWYAAAVDPAARQQQPTQEKSSKGSDVVDLDLDWTKSSKASFPRYSPWRIDGTASLLWFSLSRELQRRIELLTEADPRPRTKLPGIEIEEEEEADVQTASMPDPTATPASKTGRKSTMRKRSNVNVINVCAGFERSRDLLEYLLPPRRSSPAMNAKEEERVVADPKDTNKSGKAEKRRGAPKTFLPAPTSPSSTRSNPLTTALDSIRYFLYMCLFPLAWFFCKSPKRVAGTVTWAVIAPVSTTTPAQASASDTSPSAPRQASSPELNLAVFPGELHREGQIIRPPLPPRFLPGEMALSLWTNEEQRVKGILGL